MLFFSAKKTEIENPECEVFIQLSLFTEFVTRPDINRNINTIIIIGLKEKKRKSGFWLLVLELKVSKD